MKKRIWAISDTHCRHEELLVPENIDIVIHAGDESNTQTPSINKEQALDFLKWFSALNIEHKIFVPGNHSTAIESGLITSDYIRSLGIIHTIHGTVIVDNLKIFLSAYTPSFGQGWAFNKDRDKLDRYWSTIDSDTDIVVTHGPPRGVLDATDGRYTDPRWNERYYKLCGCTSLLSHMKRVQPKYHIFGHIHTEEMCPNSGTRTINGIKTVFVNASVVDLRRYEIVNNGIILEI